MRAVFLEELAQRGIVLDACLIAGVARATAYEWRDADSDFAKAWDDALEMAADILEREAWRRAVEGLEKPVIGRIGKDLDGIVTDAAGNEIYIREYSDTLMTKLLGARRPEKFRERNREDPTPPIDWTRVSEADQVAFLEGKISLADVVKRQQPRN